MKNMKWYQTLVGILGTKPVTVKCDFCTRPIKGTVLHDQHDNRFYHSNCSADIATEVVKIAVGREKTDFSYISQAKAQKLYAAREKQHDTDPPRGDLELRAS